MTKDQIKARMRERVRYTKRLMDEAEPRKDATLETYERYHYLRGQHEEAAHQYKRNWT